jgi:hypothetical protein
METNNIDNLRFDVDGKAFFLHHSHTDIKIGDSIKTTGAFKQATAGDSLYGYSYGWDAMNPGSISNAINNQSNAKNIYITSADAQNVYPDLNVLESNARAISEEQTVLKKITIGVDETFEQAHSRVLTSLQNLNIPMRTVQEEKLANLELAISDRGKQAVNSYLESSAETKLREIGKSIQENFDQGKFPIFNIPENLDDLLEKADEDLFVETVVDGRPTTRFLAQPLQARAYKEGGIDGLRAEIVKQHGGKLSNFSRRPEVVTQANKLLDENAANAGKKLGTLSKRTLSGILSAGETAAEVMRFIK